MKPPLYGTGCTSEGGDVLGEGSIGGSCASTVGFKLVAGVGAMSVDGDASGKAPTRFRGGAATRLTPGAAAVGAAAVVVKLAKARMMAMMAS